MRSTTTTPTEMKKTPLTLAIGSIFLTPVLAVLIAFSAVMLLLCWPFMPVLVFLSEKNKQDDHQPQPPTP
jgi:hypothetical protein